MRVFENKKNHSKYSVSDTSMEWLNAVAKSIQVQPSAPKSTANIVLGECHYEFVEFTPQIIRMLDI
jgi:hypothetical protein